MPLRRAVCFARLAGLDWGAVSDGACECGGCVSQASLEDPLVIGTAWNAGFRGDIWPFCFYSSIRPSQTSTRRLIQRLRRDPLRISESFLRYRGRPGVSCLADTVNGSGLRYWESDGHGGACCVRRNLACLWRVLRMM
ncbi:hypothetical protein TcCL_ESM11934 [Trypanosoma cruzi]|nr:hypothetical protein TcCL_ESM11934 [Trypanosoma cruzi]